MVREAPPRPTRPPQSPASPPPPHQGRSPTPASPYSSSHGAAPQRHVQALPTHRRPRREPPTPPTPPGPLAPHTDNGPRYVTRQRRRLRHTRATASAPPLGSSSAGLTPPACAHVPGEVGGVARGRAGRAVSAPGARGMGAKCKEGQVRGRLPSAVGGSAQATVRVAVPRGRSLPGS